MLWRLVCKFLLLEFENNELNVLPFRYLNFTSNMKKLFYPIWQLFPKKLKKWLRRNLVSKIYQGNDVLVEPDQLTPVFKKVVKYLKDIDEKNFGDYLEFGVYNGTSMSLMYHVFQDQKIESSRLFGFDSFEGLPEEASEDDNGMWFPGEFKCSYDKTIRALENNKVDLNKVQLIKGFYSDTLKSELVAELNIKKAGIIMIDCDMYLSAKDALNFCGPLIKERAIIIFDDWLPGLAANNLGEKKAFDEFLSNNKNLKATEFDHYKYKNRESGMVFLVEDLNA